MSRNCDYVLVWDILGADGDAERGLQVLQGTYPGGSGRLIAPHIVFFAPAKGSIYFDECDFNPGPMQVLERPESDPFRDITPADVPPNWRWRPR